MAARPTRRVVLAVVLSAVATPPAARAARPDPLAAAIRRARLADAAHRQAGHDTLTAFGPAGPRPAYWRAYRFGVLADAAVLDDVAGALARDLLAATGATITPRPDPVFALIEEARRLMREQAQLFAVSGGLPDTHPAAEATAASHSAMWEHVRGVLLKTVPTTAAGCVALARFTIEFNEDQGVPVEVDSNDPVLDLIARSPAL